MRLGQAANHSAEADGPDADDHRAKRTRRADSSEDGTAGDTQTFRLEAHRTVTGPAASTQSTMEAEIAQAKQMVIDLRRELALQTATGHVQEETGVAMPDVRRGVRRARGESSATAAIDGATTGVNGERVIRTNRTIERGGATRARAFAFNTFIFGLGVGAAAYVPLLFYSSLSSPFFCYRLVPSRLGPRVHTEIATYVPVNTMNWMADGQIPSSARGAVLLSTAVDD